MRMIVSRCLRRVAAFADLLAQHRRVGADEDAGGARVPACDANGRRR